MCILVVRVVLGKQNMLRLSFLNWLQGFWNWLSNVIRFKDANDSYSGSNEGTDSPWYYLALVIYKIPTLDIPTKTLTRNKE